MLLSKSCEYGLRAVIYLVVNDGEESYLSIKKISESLDIPYHFLTKTLQKLTQQGILESYRGPKGGVALARPAGEISVKDIVVAIDGRSIFEECVLGLPGCGDEKPCPLHDQWATARNQINSVFETMTLLTLARQIETSDVRLSAVLDLE
jgi:Rrf2 family protein